MWFCLFEQQKTGLNRTYKKGILLYFRLSLWVFVIYQELKPNVAIKPVSESKLPHATYAMNSQKRVPNLVLLPKQRRGEIMGRIGTPGKRRRGRGGWGFKLDIEGYFVAYIQQKHVKPLKLFMRKIVKSHFMTILFCSSH